MDFKGVTMSVNHEPIRFDYLVAPAVVSPICSVKIVKAPLSWGELVGLYKCMDRKS